MSRPEWLFYAVASGACAAMNGVFAKLTTTQLTATWATGISNVIGLHEPSRLVELFIRLLFLVLNLGFNAIMWGLFTRALTLASSAVRVSVINTSANFMLAALLGLVIFHESLPGTWWVGAAMLVVGSVIIGRRKEDASDGAPKTAAAELEVAASADFQDDSDALLTDTAGARDTYNRVRENMIDSGARQRSTRPNKRAKVGFESNEE